MSKMMIALASVMLLGLCLGFAGCAPASEEEVSSVLKQAAPEEVTSAPKQNEPAEPPIATPSTTGALHLEGTQLVGEDGQPVQLRGVSTHGLAWFPRYVNQAFFKELRQDWGANAVRLALYTTESGGYCTDGDQAKLERLVEDGVAFATEADLYVVVDWHILSDGDPNQHKDAAKAFFAKMSERFAAHKNVIYEICNEPNGAATWADVKAYAEEVIPIIRANAPEVLIVVGTPTWSQQVDEAAVDSLEFSNILYALHFYAATHQQDLRDKLSNAVAAGLPVFVTEFGICDASGNGSIDYDSADAWVRLMDELDVSYICWNLSNKDEASALFKPDCTKDSGFTEADLSAEGLWLQSVLQGEAPPAQEEAGSQSPTYGETVGSLSFTANVVNSWEADGKAYEQYSVTLTNSGEALSGWEVTIPLGHPFILVDSWNGVFTLRDDRLHISNADYNGTIAPGQTLTDIGFIICS